MRPSPEPYLTRDAIQRRVAELAQTLDAELAPGTLLIVVLKGAIHFASDLFRHMPSSREVDFIRAKSYAGTEPGAEVTLLIRPSAKVAGRDVVLLEDILDTGRTAAALRDHLRSMGAVSVRTCTLLDKPARRESDVEATWRGFTVEDHFFVGYGMDLDEDYRSLPEIYILESGEDSLSN